MEKIKYIIKRVSIPCKNRYSLHKVFPNKLYKNIGKDKFSKLLKIKDQNIIGV